MPDCGDCGVARGNTGTINSITEIQIARIKNGAATLPPAVPGAGRPRYGLAHWGLRLYADPLRRRGAIGVMAPTQVPVYTIIADLSILRNLDLGMPKFGGQKKTPRGAGSGGALCYLECSSHAKSTPPPCVSVSWNEHPQDHSIVSLPRSNALRLFGSPRDFRAFFFVVEYVSDIFLFLSPPLPAGFDLLHPH